MLERALEPNELGDLRNIDRDALLDPWVQGQIQRLIAEIERAGRRHADFFRIERYRSIHLCDAIFQRKAHDGALELCRRIARAKRIQRVHELIERMVEIELGIDERRRESPCAVISTSSDVAPPRV